jgi:hypothetical protein
MLIRVDATIERGLNPQSAQCQDLQM